MEFGCLGGGRRCSLRIGRHSKLRVASGSSDVRKQGPECEAPIVPCSTGLVAVGGSTCSPGATEPNDRRIVKIGILRKISLPDLVGFQIVDVIVAQVVENAWQVGRNKA